MNSLEKMQLAVEALTSRRGQNIVVLDLRGLTIIADYFVIATGSSTVNIRAQVDAVLDTMRKHDIKSIQPEGMTEATWVLLDLGDVIVHIFDTEQRDFYQLERLWVDAPRVPVPEEKKTE
ncbi:MAG: ribosome silencing factor [Armatimonadota bacterium]